MNKPKLPSIKEYEERIKRLQVALKESQLGGALLFQRVDVCYFSGTGQNAALFVPPTGQALLMVRQSFIRAQNEQVAGLLTQFRRMEDISRILMEHGIHPQGNPIGLELDILPVLEFQKLERSLNVQEFQNISPLVLNLRMIKSPTELELMKQAARVVKIGHERVSEVLETHGAGIREIELAAEVEAAMRRAGHEGIIHLRRWNQDMFFGHILSGPNGAMPSYVASPTGGQGASIVVPQGAGSRKIQKDEPIMVDIVAAHHGYYVDAARTYVIGKLSNSLLDAHETTVQILNQIVKDVHPGIRANQVYELAMMMAHENGYDQGFMGCTDDRAPFLGHGIGMEVDEPPALTRKNEIQLKPNMCLAIEPKIAFQKEGVVGVEDTLHLTDTGLKSLVEWKTFLEIV